MSGGMDQTICMTASRGFAKRIAFVPALRAQDVRLPSSCRFSWFVANCLLEHQLQSEEGTTNYNTRVVECRLFTLLLAKLLKFANWKKMKTPKDIQTQSGLTLASLIAHCKQLLDAKPYSIAYLEKEFGMRLEDLMPDLLRSRFVLNNLRNLKYDLPLRLRALHVYGEAQRVVSFCNLCNDETATDIEQSLGALMNLSHASCCDNYDCSCDALNVLQSECINGGALGARLTGAGWGGCIVSLVEADKVDALKQHLMEKYYANIKNVPGDAMFATSPYDGLCVITCS